MILFDVIGLLLLTGLALGVKYDSINSSCVDPSYVIPAATALAAIGSANYPGDNLTYFQLPIYTEVRIDVDLRHLQSINQLQDTTFNIFIFNRDQNSTPSIQIQPLNISDNFFDLYAGNNLIVAAYFDIPQNWSALKYLVLQSASFTFLLATSNTSSQSSFLFQVTNTDQINLPYNAVDSQALSNYPGYFLSIIKTSGKPLMSRAMPSISYNDYWGSTSSEVLPYLPYLSNCEYEGDYIFFSQITNNASECNLVGEAVQPINQFAFGSSPLADTCTIKRSCVYDENPSQKTAYPIWNILSSTSTIFQVSTEQYTNAEYSLGLNLDSSAMIPCKIDASEGDNSSTSSFPQKITMSFGYYQVSTTEKRMITCKVGYSLYVSTANLNTTSAAYQLQINFSPLNHTSILLNFGFNWYIYMIVFVLFGLISNIQYGIFWIYHYLISFNLKRKFHFKIYLQVFKQLVWGASLIIFLLLFFTFFVQIVMNGAFFNSPISAAGNWSFWDSTVSNAIGINSQTTIGDYRAGRVGVSYIVIGTYLIIDLSKYLIGKEKKKKEYEQYEVLGRVIEPMQWNIGKLLFGDVVVVFLSLALIYFAYSSVYSNNIWTFIVLTKIFQMVFEEVAFSVYEDNLPCLPFKIWLNIVAFLNTLSATDLYQFLLSYLIDVATTLIELAYISQLQSKITDYIQEKIEEVTKFYTNLMNDEQEEEEKATQPQQLTQDRQNQYAFIDKHLHQVELLLQDIKEEYNDEARLTVFNFQPTQAEINLKKEFILFMENKSKVKANKNLSEEEKKQKSKEIEEEQNTELLEMAVQNMLNMLGFIIQPIIVLVFWTTYIDSNILNAYGMSYDTINLYFLYSVVLAVVSFPNTIMAFYTLESYMNVQYKEPIAKMLDKFRKRTKFWVADDGAIINEEVRQKMRGSQHYCLSSQFFFILTGYVSCLVIIILGIAVCIQAPFNPFKDVVTIPISIFWIVFTKIFLKILEYIACKLNIWDYNSFQSEHEGKKKNILRIHDRDRNLDRDEKDMGQEEEEQATQQVMLVEDESSASLSLSQNKSQSEAEDGKRVQFKRKQSPSFEAKKQQLLQRQKDREAYEFAKSKLATICKKLEPEFSKDTFRIEFCHSNKQYIKENLQQILPLVSSFPQYQDFVCHSIDKRDSDVDFKRQNKNMDPFIGQIMSKWLKITQLNRQRKIADGIQRESKLKKCNFCFKTWSLYYGHDGICLQCSKKLIQAKKND